MKDEKIFSKPQNTKGTLRTTKFTPIRLTRIAIVAALYVAVTLAIAPIAFSEVQFRVSEVLVLLCFYKKDYCYSLSIGCLISNIFSTMPMFDVPFGTVATIIAVICIANSKNLLLATLFPIITNGVIVGVMLNLVFDVPIHIAIAGVAFGEFVVVTVLGTAVFRILERRKSFMKLIDADQNLYYI